VLIYDWFFKQAVTEENMNDAFGAVQTSMFNLITDQGLIGIAQGGTVTQDSPTPDLTVIVGGPFYAYDQLGQRIFTAGTGSNPGLDLSQDSAHVSTAVAGGGNEKWISIFIQFERVLSDPQIDGNGATVFYIQSESFQYLIVQGAEAPVGTATQPALINPGLLIADVRRTFGVTTIHNADILQSPTSTLSGKSGRMKNTFNIPGSPLSLTAGTVADAISTMLTQLNTLTAGDFTNGADPGTRFSLASGTVASQLSAIQEQIDDIMTDGSDATASVADLTALRAIGPADRFANQSIFVNPNLGLYFWNPGGAGADDGVFTILPADAPVTGRWTLDLKGAIGIANGIPQLDSTVKVPLLQTHWAIVGAFYDETAGGGAWQFSGVPGDMAFHLAPGGPMHTFTGLQVGDKIAVEMMFQYAFSVAGTFFTLNWTQNGSAITLPQWTSDVRTPPESQTNGYFRAIFDAVAGSNAIHFGYNAGNNTQNLLINPVDGHIVVYRP